MGGVGGEEGGHGARRKSGRELVCAAGRRGVYLYLDRRIFSTSNDMSNLNAFMSAAPKNAAVEYIRAVTADGTDGSRWLVLEVLKS